MADIQDITNGESGLTARQKLNLLFAFYNQIAASDAGYVLSNLEVAFIKSLVPTGQFLRDDGTWQTLNYAPLNLNGFIDANYLPSYVDDVLEFANLAAFPVTGETAKIYVDLATNTCYRWGGSLYIELTSASAVWGSIAGLIANQPDLQNALNLKANKSTIKPATATKITYNADGIITGGVNATTLDILPTANRQYITGGQSAIINSQSGINTGDQTLEHTLSIGNFMGNSQTITSLDGQSVLKVADTECYISKGLNYLLIDDTEIHLDLTDGSETYANVALNGSGVQLSSPRYTLSEFGFVIVTDARTAIVNSSKIEIDGPIINIPQLTANKILRLNALKNLESTNVDVTDLELLTNKGIANGYVPLNALSKIDPIYLDSQNAVVHVAGFADFDFGTQESDTVRLQFASPNVNDNIKSVYFQPIETPETSLEDFYLNGLSFNIEKTGNHTLYNIRATAAKGAVGIYKVKYVLTI